MCVCVGTLDSWNRPAVDVKYDFWGFRVLKSGVDLQLCGWERERESVYVSQGEGDRQTGASQPA